MPAFFFSQRLERSGYTALLRARSKSTGLQATASIGGGKSTSLGAWCCFGSSRQRAASSPLILVSLSRYFSPSHTVTSPSLSLSLSLPHSHPHTPSLSLPLCSFPCSTLPHVLLPLPAPPVTSHPSLSSSPRPQALLFFPQYLAIAEDRGVVVIEARSQGSGSQLLQTATRQTDGQSLPSHVKPRCPRSHAWRVPVRLLLLLWAKR